MKTSWEYNEERAGITGIDNGGLRVLVAEVWGNDVAEINGHGRLIAAALDLLIAAEATLEREKHLSPQCRELLQKAIEKAIF